MHQQLCQADAHLICSLPQQSLTHCRESQLPRLCKFWSILGEKERFDRCRPIASLPTGRKWWGCASRVTVCGSAEFHPVSARALSMATASGTGICANLSRECGRSAVTAVSGGSISYRRTSFPPIQRISGFRAAASIAGRTSGFNLSRTLRVAGRPEAGFINVRCEAAEAGKGIGLEQTENQTESMYNISKNVMRSDVNWAVVKESAFQRVAGIFVGSALLVASLGLGLTRSALARAPPPSTLSTTSTVFNEEATEQGLDDSNTADAEEAGQSESALSQPTKEEEEDPAELVLLRYLARHPEDVKTLEGLLYVRLRKGSIANALETVDSLLELRPDHAPFQLIRAQSLEFLGDHEAARHAFEKILEKDPLSARALQGLATAMLKVGEGPEMIEMLRRAVQVARDAGKTKEATNLRILLGQMYTLQGDLQEALAQYQELEKEDPNDFRPYLCQGLVYSLLDQKTDAEKAFLKYRRRCPKTFPERGYLDDLMISAKTTARKLQTEEKLKPAKKGKRKLKRLQQPNIDTAFSENPEGPDGEEVEE